MPSKRIKVNTVHIPTVINQLKRQYTSHMRIETSQKNALAFLSDKLPRLLFQYRHVSNFKTLKKEALKTFEAIINAHLPQITKQQWSRLTYYRRSTSQTEIAKTAEKKTLSKEEKALLRQIKGLISEVLSTEMTYNANIKILLEQVKAVSKKGQYNEEALVEVLKTLPELVEFSNSLIQNLNAIIFAKINEHDQQDLIKTTVSDYKKLLEQRAATKMKTDDLQSLNDETNTLIKVLINIFDKNQLIAIANQFCLEITDFTGKTKSGFKSYRKLVPLLTTIATQLNQTSWNSFIIEPIQRAPRLELFVKEFEKNIATSKEPKKVKGLFTLFRHLSEWNVGSIDSGIRRRIEKAKTKFNANMKKLEDSFLSSKSRRSFFNININTVRYGGFKNKKAKTLIFQQISEQIKQATDKESFLPLVRKIKSSKRYTKLIKRQGLFRTKSSSEIKLEKLLEAKSKYLGVDYPTKKKSQTKQRDTYELAKAYAATVPISHYF